LSNRLDRLDVDGHVLEAGVGHAVGDERLAVLDVRDPGLLGEPELLGAG
jgi:hypothetical protein